MSLITSFGLFVAALLCWPDMCCGLAEIHYFASDNQHIIVMWYKVEQLFFNDKEKYAKNLNINFVIKYFGGF